MILLVLPLFRKSPATNGSSTNGRREFPSDSEQCHVKRRLDERCQQRSLQSEAILSTCFVRTRVYCPPLPVHTVLVPDGHQTFDSLADHGLLVWRIGRDVVGDDNVALPNDDDDDDDGVLTCYSSVAVTSFLTRNAN